MMTYLKGSTTLGLLLGLLFCMPAVQAADEQDDLRQWFTIEGQLEVEAQHQNELLQGPARWYFANGQLAYEAFFEQGIRQGEAKAYYPHGQIKLTCTYKDGELDGEAQWFDAAGSLTQSLMYSEGAPLKHTARIVPNLHRDFAP